jgi:hypothetical protein
MKCLFLIGTPFQAFLAKRIILAEGLKQVDAWYVAYPKTPKAERYHRELAEIANVVFDARKPGKIRGLGYALTRRHFRESYDRVYCALTQPYYFRSILHRAKEIRTFDDGAGNYVPKGLDGLERFQDRAFARIFFLPSHDEILRRSVAHYAVRPDLPNVGGPPERIVPVDLGVRRGNGQTPLTLAIGQPFDLDLPPEKAAKIRQRLSGLPYFPHPSELSPPPDAIRSDNIIEDYVAGLSQDHDVTLVGWFTTAMLTIPNVKKIYLDADGNPSRRATMVAAGCEVEALG